MANNYFNPFEQFQRPDFSLWAQPDTHSTISEKPGPLQPKPTSPLYGANAAPLSTDSVSVGGISMPAPKAAPLAPTASSPVNQDQSMFGKLHDKILNHITGDAPQGYEGILTPDEIKGARPNLLQSLFTAPDQPMAAARWQRNLDELVGHKQQAAGIVANQRVQADTAKIFADNPPPQSGSPADFAKWANQVIPALAAKGNFNAVKELTPLVKDYNAETAKAVKDEDPVWEDFGGYKALVNKKTGKEITRVNKTVAPKTAAEIDQATKFGADQKNKILDDYARDTKDFHQVMSGWDVLKGATKNPTLATPFAITDAYARITNPGAIVRPTTMEMIDNMGSVGQRMRKFWDHNANGALPPDIMKDFQTTLYNIVKEHKNQYDQIRAQALTRARQTGISEKDMGALLQDYQVDDPNAPVNNFSKWGVTPVRKP